MRERKNACERNRSAKGGKIEREKEGPIWADFELISRWLVVVAYNGDDLAKGMRERNNAWERNRSGKGRKERERKKKTKAQSGLSLNWSCGGSWWLLVMVTTSVMVAACGGAMKGQWEERALGKRKKNEEGEETEKRTGWNENAKLIFGERRYVMGQVIWVDPILCLILQKCHWNLIFKNWKHQNLVFIFHHPHPKFWVFESWKQWSKTKPNKWSFVGPTRFGDGSWKLSDITQFSCYPNMLLCFLSWFIISFVLVCTMIYT